MATVTNWLLGREPLVTRGDDALVPLRVPWYRSLPLASVETLSVTVDGRPVPDADVRLTLGDADYSLAELAERPDDFWFVQDTAFVRVPSAGLGERAEVTASATFRIPYIFVGPDTPLRRLVTETRTLDVIEQD